MPVLLRVFYHLQSCQNVDIDNVLLMQILKIFRQIKPVSNVIEMPTTYCSVPGCFNQEVHQFSAEIQ